MVLLRRFWHKLRLRQQFQHSLRMSQRRADDRPCDLILALRFAIMAGLRRIHKTEILPYNGTFLSLLGLPHIPDQTTDSSSVSAPKSYANGSPCTIGFGL